MARNGHSHDLTADWRDAFLSVVQTAEVANPLKEASLSEQLGEWTRLLTAAVVTSCERVGWTAAAKGFRLDFLPQVGQEYLGIDVMAFRKSHENPEARWRFPVAVVELENSREDDRVAYSLWKVLCLQSKLRVVFAYRKDWEQARKLVVHLSSEVVEAMSTEERTDLKGQTLAVIGSRGEGETFPWGYFKFWELNADLGRFIKV